VHLNNEAHRSEHSLEVQLPFLQTVLSHFSLVPIVIGSATMDEVAQVLRELWDGDDTLIVVSSDLSHFLDYATARGVDSESAHSIEHCDTAQLDGRRACGYRGIQGLLQVAQEQHLHIKTIDLKNSGDTTGDLSRVVGYGSFVVYA
jgi:AmmeMemoRadiSam system protein B